jgi:hypothetical protein
MDEQKDAQQQSSEKELDKELEDLDAGEDADKVSGGWQEADPCAGGKLE